MPETTMLLHPDIETVLLTEAAIQQRVRELGAAITADYAGERPVLLGILNGAMVFLTDLMRTIDLPLTMDLIALSSYGPCTSAQGAPSLLKPLITDIAGKHVLIVEDIVDSGASMRFALDYLRPFHPAGVKIAALLSKPSRRQVAIEVDYLGFEVPDLFVVGYGLDYAQQYRHLPYIGVLRREVYARRD